MIGLSLTTSQHDTVVVSCESLRSATSPTTTASGGCTQLFSFPSFHKFVVYLERLSARLAQKLVLRQVGEEPVLGVNSRLYRVYSLAGRAVEKLVVCENLFEADEEDSGEIISDQVTTLRVMII